MLFVVVWIVARVSNIFLKVLPMAVRYSGDGKVDVGSWVVLAFAAGAARLWRDVTIVQPSRYGIHTRWLP